MIRYFNIRVNGEAETIDEINSADYNSNKEFKAEANRLLAEYTMAHFGGVYLSPKSTKEWGGR